VLVDPFEPTGFAIELMQRSVVTVDSVQRANQARNARMTFIVEQRPRQLGIMVPFVGLAKFLSHKQQLFARMRPHESKVRPQIGEALPIVTRHSSQQRAFAVHHFIMRQRQHEIFAESIRKTEGHFRVVPAAMNGVFLHVAQGVVHPAHIPFEVEAQTACVGRRRNAGEGSGFLSYRHRAYALLVEHFVDVFEERNRLIVFTTSVNVRHPLRICATVVSVEHGSHSVHAYAINAKPLQPVQRATG